MLIALVGPRCSGKKTIAQHLISDHSFTLVSLSQCTEERIGSAVQDEDQLCFDNDEELMNYATSHWRQDLVTVDLRDQKEIEKFLKRPWFVLVLVQARLLDRWRRRISEHSRVGKSPTPLTFEEFAKEDDIVQFGPQPDHLIPQLQSISLTSQPSAYYQVRHNTPLEDLIPHISYSITNHDGEILKFLETISQSDLPKMKNNLRPNWDVYFMSLANLASLRSNCMKRRVGAVLVTHRDKRVLSTGYNGTPRGMTNCNEGGCSRCNGTKANSGLAAREVSRCGVNLNECLCLHAEENALLEAGRDRMGLDQGTTLYCNTCPCLRCSVKIVQCGVKEVVYSLSYSMDAGAAAVFAEAGVTLRQLVPS